MPVTVYCKNGNQSEQAGGESVDHDWFVPSDARTPRVILVKAAGGATARPGDLGATSCRGGGT